VKAASRGLIGPGSLFVHGKRPMTDLRITDHALLRYLERVRGFSFNREKQAILEICRGVQHGRVKKDGCVFEVRNGTLITILPNTGCPNGSIWQPRAGRRST
jgi:hypothetical protein